MGRKVSLNMVPRILAIIALGVSLIATAGCLGGSDNDDHHHHHTLQYPIGPIPQILVAKGLIDDEGNISVIFLDVELYGDDGIEMRDVVVYIRATPSDGPAECCDLIYGPVGSIDDENYGVRELFDPNNTWNPEGTPASYILGKDCLLELEVNLTASAVPLPPNSTLDILIHVTATGHQTYDLFRTPTAYPATGTVWLED